MIHGSLIPLLNDLGFIRIIYRIINGDLPMLLKVPDSIVLRVTSQAIKRKNDCSEIFDTVRFDDSLNINSEL